MTARRAASVREQIVLAGVVGLALVAAVVTLRGAHPPWDVALGLGIVAVVAGLALGRRFPRAAWRIGVATAGGVAIAAGPAPGVLVGVVAGGAGPARRGEVVGAGIEAGLTALAAAAVGGAALGGVDLLPGLPIVDGAGLAGSPPVRVGLAGAVAGGLAVVPALILVRAGRAWLDDLLDVPGSVSWSHARRVRAGPPPAGAAPWWDDVTDAAVTVLLPVLWALAPLLALLPLVTLLPRRRPGSRSHPAGAPPSDRSGHGGRGTVSAALRRATTAGSSVGVLHVLVDPPGDGAEERGPPSPETVRAVERGLRAALTGDEVVGRTGAVDFTVVLPGADPAVGEEAARRLHTALRDGPVRSGSGATVSVGMATGSAGPGDRTDLRVEAETAASAARAQGGDRTVRADRLPPAFRGADVDPDGGADTAGTGRPLDGDSLVRVATPSLDESRTGARGLLQGVLGAAGLACVLAVLLSGRVGVDPGELLVLGALAVAAEASAVAIAHRAAASWTVAPLVATVVVVGASPVTVAGVAVAAGLLGGLVRGTGVRQATFNAATFVLAALTALGAVSWLPGGGGALADAVVGGLVGGAAFVAVDATLVALAVATSPGATLAGVWRRDVVWLVPHQLGLGVLGGVLAFAEGALGAVGPVLLALPAVGLHVTLWWGLSSTTRSLARLRARDEELTVVRDRLAAVNGRLTGALGRSNRGYLATLDVIADAVDDRDGYDGPHVDRVAVYGRRVLEVLDPRMANDEALLWAFRLHDVGKLHLPDDLLRHPGPLSDEQWELMRQHPRLGVDLIRGAPLLDRTTEVVLHHHERWDGTGYPFGLAGRSIPQGARVLAVVDAFDAMTSDRPYRPALEVEEALHELVRGRGTRYDPEVLDAFLQLSVAELETLRTRVDEGARRSPSALWLGLGLSRADAGRPGPG